MSQLNTPHGHSRMDLATQQANRAKSDGKIKLAIQLRSQHSKELLNVQVPQGTSIGKIMAYLAKQYGMSGDVLYLTPLKTKQPMEQLEERIAIIFKSSVGKQEEAKLNVPRHATIKQLKKALGRKFGIPPEDFQLVQVAD